MTKINLTAEPRKQEITTNARLMHHGSSCSRTCTDPELYTQWIGPRGLTTTLETFEPKTEVCGGISRKTQTATSTHSMA